MNDSMDIRKLIRTTSYNVVRLGSGFVMVAILPILARRLDQDDYNLWTLVTQVPAYVGLMASGLSVAVVRFVAASGEGPSQANEVVRVGTYFALRLAGLAVLGAGVLAAVLPLVYREVPADLVGVGRVGVLLLGLGAAWALVSTSYVSYFNGIQDNAGSSIAATIVRVAGAGAVVLAASSGLSAMFLAFAMALAANTAVQRQLYLRRMRAYISTSTAPPLALRREVLSYLKTFAIWITVSLLANGLDVAIVGVLDYQKIGAYGAAAGMVTVISGLHSALMNAFLPDVSRREDPSETERATRVATRIGGLLAWWSVGLLIAFGAPMMEFLFQGSLGRDAYEIMVVLAIGRGIGNLIWPYVVGVLAIGEHRKIRITPVIEGVCNFVLSISLVARYGAVGAAVGTLIASMVAVGLHLWVNVPRTTSLVFSRRRWFIEGVFESAVPVVPLLAVPVALSRGGGSVGIVTAAGLAAVSGALVAWSVRSAFAIDASAQVAE